MLNWKLGIAIIIVLVIIILMMNTPVKPSTRVAEHAQGAGWKYSTDLSRRVPMMDGGFLRDEEKENRTFVRGGTTFFPRSDDRRPSA